MALPEEPMEEGGGEPDELEAAASAFSAALKSGSPKRIAATFRRMKYACESTEENGSPDDLGI